MSASLADIVADNIRTEARRQGVKHPGLAERLGYSSTSVAQRWRGDVPWKLAELPAVAEALHVELQVLLGIEVAVPKAPDLSDVEARIEALDLALRQTSLATLAAVEKAHEEASAAARSSSASLAPLTMAQHDAEAALAVGSATIAPVAKAQDDATTALQASQAAIALVAAAQQDALRALEASTATLAAASRAHDAASTAALASADAWGPIGDSHEVVRAALAATAAALHPVERRVRQDAVSAVTALEHVHAEASRLALVDEALQALREQVRNLT